MFKAFEEDFAMVFEKGCFEVFKIGNEDRVYAVKNMEAADHEEDILSIDFDYNHRLLLTGSV